MASVGSINQHGVIDCLDYISRFMRKAWLEKRANGEDKHLFAGGEGGSGSRGGSNSGRFLPIGVPCHIECSVSNDFNKTHP